MFHKQLKLFQDPDIEYPIHDLNLNFEDYIKKSKKIIANYRQDLKTNSEFIINANAPFELRPASTSNPKKGALLIHGLFDSPLLMKDIGKHLQSQGFLVRSILLPGHGTVPGALLNIDFQEWLQAVRYGTARLAEDVEQIFLVGYSTGASLALYHAAQNHLIAGIIMLSPAFKIRSLFDFATNWYRGISWALPQSAWLRIAPENDYAKYQSVALNSAYQVYRLGKETKKIKSTKWSHCPIFMAIVADDKVVSSTNSIHFFKNNPNPKNKLIIYSRKKPAYKDSRIMVRPVAYPEMNIFNLSHLSLPISPDNSHYGMNGDYIDASRIDKNKYKYGLQNKLDEKIFNLLYRFKLTKMQYRRLTFNPDFNFLMDEVDKFILQV